MEFCLRFGGRRCLWCSSNTLVWVYVVRASLMSEILSRPELDLMLYWSWMPDPSVSGDAWVGSRSTDMIRMTSSICEGCRFWCRVECRPWKLSRGPLSSQLPPRQPPIGLFWTWDHGGHASLLGRTVGVHEVFVYYEQVWWIVRCRGCYDLPYLAVFVFCLSDSVC